MVPLSQWRNWNWRIVLTICTLFRFTWFLLSVMGKMGSHSGDLITFSCHVSLDFFFWWSFSHSCLDFDDIYSVKESWSGFDSTGICLMTFSRLAWGYGVWGGSGCSTVKSFFCFPFLQTAVFGGKSLVTMQSPHLSGELYSLPRWQCI